MWRQFAAFVLLLVASTAALPPGQPSAAPGPLATFPAKRSGQEVAEYARTFDVSAREASDTLNTQEKGAGVVEVLRQTLGSQYAGIWFDNTAGEFVVPLAAKSDAIRVQRAFNDLGLAPSTFRLADARFTWTQLENKKERLLEQSLSKPFLNGEIQASIDPRANHVSVTLSGTANEGRSAEVADAVNQYGPAAEIERKKFNPIPVACSFGDCDPPLRGGVAITPKNSPGTMCSAGFKALGNANGNRFVLTAGHCTYGVSTYLAQPASSPFESKEIGPVEATYTNASGYDVGLIKANGGYWDTTPWPTEVVYWSPKESYEAVNPHVAITAEASSYIGEWACHSGQSSGTSCGTVKEVDLDLSFETEGRPQIRNDLSFVTGPELCIEGGDSGGPVFTGNTALGITSAMEGELPIPCGNGDYYSEITEDSDLLGVHVASRVGAPPSAITEGVTSVDFSQATIKGTVDASGIPTTYYFEYGKTTAYGSATGSASAGSGFLPGTFSSTIGSLSPGTSYHYRIVATNSSGTSYGADRQFSTLSLTPSEGEEDYSPGPRSTVDPTNNSVNVFYRTPSGSLGHRWHAPWESGWGSETLAGSLSSEPHLIVDRDGGINVFYRTPSGTLGHNWWEAGGTGWGSESLGGSLAANAEPHAIVDSNKVVNVFYRTPSGSLGHRWHAPWESGWGSETLAGSVASEPHAIVDKDGGINVFYRTPSGTLGHNWWEAGGTGWGSESLGGSLAANAEPHAIVEPNNSVHVFYRTASGSLGHRWHAPWESGWGSETLAGSLDSSAEPHAIVDKNGGVNVFYRTPSGTLGHNWWEVGNNVWGSEDLGGSLASEPHAIVDPTNNSVNVFYRTPSGSLGHRWHAPWESGWGSETLAGSLSSEPHLIVDRDGGINVFYRTPSGTLGHNWWEAGGTGWGSESLGGSLAPTPPSATTGAASGVGANEAKLEGTVNPNGSPTSYYFEYGPTTSYGSKAPASAAEAGYGTAAVAVSQALSGLSPSTTYHYRLVATGPEGTATGQDKTFATKAATVASQLAALPVTEPFDGSSGSLANFGSKWSTLGWAAGGSPKGADTTTGWGPVNAFSTINGAYFNTSVSAGGLGSAVVATMAVNPGLTERHFSLWLNMSTPGGTKAGYELRFQNTAANAYEVRLLKWVGASEAQLASKTGYSFSNGSSFALVDQGATVSAWTDTGSGFAQQLSAADSAFSSGYAGLQGAGSTTRLRNFKAGGI